MRQLAIVAAVLFVVGCAPSMTFNADNAEALAPRAHSASRLEHVRSGCETLGTLTFEQNGPVVDSEIQAIADKVASVGGTHYVVRNRTTMTRSGRTRPASPVVHVLVCASTMARR